MNSFIIPGSSKGKIRLTRQEKKYNIQKLLDLIIDNLNTDEYYTDRLSNFNIPVNITADFFRPLLNSVYTNYDPGNVLKDIKQLITKKKLLFIKKEYILQNENEIIIFLLENKDILYFLELLPAVLLDYFDKKRKVVLALENSFDSKEKTLNILINTSDLSVDHAFQSLINFKTDFLLKKDDEFLRRIHINVT